MAPEKENAEETFLSHLSAGGRRGARFAKGFQRGVDHAALIIRCGLDAVQHGRVRTIGGGAPRRFFRAALLLSAHLDDACPAIPGDHVDRTPRRIVLRDQALPKSDGLRWPFG